MKINLWLARGQGWGGINWKIGMDIYTLLYIQHIAISNKHLFYSTGNCTLSSVMTDMGK